MEQNRKSLMITLGHNSSAIFYDGRVVMAYEEERLDGIKSSSCFPSKSIDRIKSMANIKNAFVFVSHWYDGFDLFNIEDKKHIDSEYLKKLISDFDLIPVFLDENFTHHDAHAYSSLAFLKDRIVEKDLIKFVGEDVYFLVVDGFGNKQETMSLYKTKVSEAVMSENTNLQFVDRMYGYNTSLGLMYQYATRYCGMKENQDEYKFLGYESHILGILNADKLRVLKDLVEDTVEDIWNLNEEPVLTKSYINIKALNDTCDSWFKLFDRVLGSLDIGRENSFDLRVIIGYFIQKVLEIALSKLVDKHNIKNLCVSGGVFYNVKLNNCLLKKIEGVLSVMPLAGDQGAAIGMYQKVFGDFRFGDLCFGTRDSFDYSVLKEYADIAHLVIVTEDRLEAKETALALILNNDIVNVVEGNMEFGPRALCHTSTLALPNSKNVDHINALNKRNTVMPMAPVMLEDNMEFFFSTDMYDRVIGSDSFMIVTYDYNDNVDKEIYRGVMHKYPESDTYSGRPQVVKSDEDKLIKDILKDLPKEYRCLINTSFNIHGNPILFSYRSVLEDLRFQFNTSKNLGLASPYLIVLC